MSSTYSPSLKLELIGNGDQSGTWGTTTNNNLGTLLEQAITGVQAITMSNTDYTLSNFNGTSDEARNAVLVVSGTNSAIRKIVAPQGQNKTYIISNQTTGGYAITIGAPTGTAVTIPSGITAQVYTDGADFYSSLSGAAGSFNVNGNLTVGGTATITGEIFGAISNLYGGAANQIPYQSGTSTTTFINAPTLTGTALVYNGTGFVWSTVASAVASGAIYENTQNITQTYTMTTGNNGESVGPITVASGVSVTIPSGSRWVIL